MIHCCALTSKDGDKSKMFMVNTLDKHPAQEMIVNNIPTDEQSLFSVVGINITT